MYTSKRQMLTILITGGCGYIGSHACVKGLQDGHNVIILDNLSNSTPTVLTSINALGGREVKFYKGSIDDKTILNTIFNENKVDLVMHFAALKDANEGELQKELYFQNNTTAAFILLESMKINNVKNIIFSSTAAVYGNPEILPITIDTPTSPINQYGLSKSITEDLIKYYVDNYGFSGTIFRYFNVVGNHESGELGEELHKAKNLLPVLLGNLVAINMNVHIFGDQFETKDGTQMRDYVDVNDIVEAHYLAIKYSDLAKIHTFNLSTGIPTSCLEMINHILDVTGQDVNYTVSEPRKNDPIISYCVDKSVQELLNWKTKYTITDSITNQWKYIRKNYQYVQ
jgi:UDP-glucose 4-epimerase